jgi:glutamyl/glutaminyl-tRNA synthetase
MAPFSKQFKLTRIAPTPSGYLHLGNAFSFALTAAIAKDTGGEILLRIDDMDRDRVEMPYINDIFDTLNFLNIPWQQGPQNVAEHQSHWSQFFRLNNYQPALDKLVAEGCVFACSCSRRQLQTMGYECTCAARKTPLDMPDVAWRIQTDDRKLSINTLVDGVVIKVLPAEMKNFIIRKKDGYPAYQLTSLIDDVHFGSDLIIRGEDLWQSTIAQHYLASIIGITSFAERTFHHHKLLTDNTCNKLSKSAGSSSIQQMRGLGISSAQVYAQIGAMVMPGKTLSHWTDLSHNDDL